MISRTVAHDFISMLPSWIIPVGGYRRGHANMKDIDLLTTRPMIEIARIIGALATSGKFTITKIEKAGTEYISFTVKHLNQKFNVDIWHTTPAELPYALFHRTGNRNFNIRTRAQAERLGYLLNEHGLWKRLPNDRTRLIKVKTERELFKKLNITYKAPEERDD